MFWSVSKAIKDEFAAVMSQMDAMHEQSQADQAEIERLEAERASAQVEANRLLDESRFCCSLLCMCLCLSLCASVSVLRLLFLSVCVSVFLGFLG